MNTLFQLAAKNRKIILQSFLILYTVLIFGLIVGGYIITQNHPWSLQVYAVGVIAGKISALFFIIVLLPGIFRRFTIHHPLLSLIMFFRRQLGVLTYLFGFIHFAFVRLIYQLMTRQPASFAVFEFYGVIALQLMFLLFLTSNDFSVKKLGVWWKRLHKLVYIIVWLIFLHVALQANDIFTWLLGITAVAEVVSIIFNSKKSLGKLPIQ